jgi:TrmH family RNA methyltransferase
VSELITSLQNKIIKLAASIKQKKYRDELGLFAVEGVRLTEEATHSGWPTPYCIYTETAACNERVQDILSCLSTKGCKLIQVSSAIYDKVTDTKQPQGIMILVEKRVYCLEDLIAGQQQPLLVVLDGIQDPGNVGTVIRTADAAGCTGVIVTTGCADLFSGKTVRSSMGSLFHLPIVEDFSQVEILTFLKMQHISILATTLEDSVVYYKCDLTGAAAIVLGNEGKGVSEEMLREADARLHIPLYGKAESLNVAAAASVILYEAVRQRCV